MVRKVQAESTILKLTSSSAGLNDLYLADATGNELGVPVAPVAALETSEASTVQAVMGFNLGFVRAISFKAFTLAAFFVASSFARTPGARTLLTGFLTGFFATAFFFFTGFFTGFFTAFLTTFLVTVFVFVFVLGFVAVVLLALGFATTLVAVTYERWRENEV